MRDTALSSSKKLKHYIYSRLRLDVAFKTKRNVLDKRSIATIITVIFNSNVYKKWLHPSMQVYVTCITFLKDATLICQICINAMSTSFYNMSIKLKSLKGQNLQDQPQLSQHNNILTNRVKCMLPNAHCK